MTQATGVLIIGHGSRDRAALMEFSVLASAVGKRLPEFASKHAYLEFSEPSIAGQLDAFRAVGTTRILAIPALLFAAGHANSDIPGILDLYQAEHPEVAISYGQILGPVPDMIAAAGGRIREAARNNGGKFSDTALLVIGRGASDPSAQAGLWQVMRGLWSELGFGWGEVAFAGMNFPDVEAALAHTVRLGYSRIAVLPYFLSTGILLRRIDEVIDRAAKANPTITFLKAGHLKDHPLVVETLVARILELGRA
ncbi:MAG: sirohydrochlorin chelatase [Alphaproteobacteria bacterium]|nr:sirohydrochlorin chelatase [Alphaproteobacteria bacterium]